MPSLYSSNILTRDGLVGSFDFPWQSNYREGKLQFGTRVSWIPPFHIHLSQLQLWAILCITEYLTPAFGVQSTKPRLPSQPQERAMLCSDYFIVVTYSGSHFYILALPLTLTVTLTFLLFCLLFYSFFISLSLLSLLSPSLLHSLSGCKVVAYYPHESKYRRALLAKPLSQNSTLCPKSLVASF